MDCRLLLTTTLMLVGATTSYAQLAYTFVGQPTGTSYVSLTPAITLTGQAYYPGAGGIGQTHQLDIDADGRLDVEFRAIAYASASGYSEHSAYIQGKHADMEVYAALASSTVGTIGVRLASGDTLQPVMHKRSAGGKLGAWKPGQTVSGGGGMLNSFELAIVVGGEFPYSGGDWLDRQEHYLGFRIRANSTAPWRYGWLRLQVPSTTNPLTLLIKEYAVASQPLGLLTAQATGWQLYPLPVADWLTVAPPTAVEPGRLTVYDLSGRRLLHTTLAGSRQAVDLTSLAAGVYLLELETTAGRVSQRIVKQ